MSEARTTHILNLRQQFEMYYGPIDTPRQVTRYYEFVSRQTGRTTAMVEAIAKRVKAGELSIVVVHRQAYSNDIIRLVAEHLNADRAAVAEIKKLIKFATYKDKPNWEDQLRGLRAPVFVDNVVLEMRAAEFVGYLNAMYNPPVRKDQHILTDIEKRFYEAFGIKP